MLRRILIGLVVVILAGGAIFFAIAYKPAVDPLPEGEQQAFAPAVIARGAQLAAIGACTSCHTAEEGQDFAGGLELPTPFGTLYSTNITPDSEDGIGRWSEAAFTRSMREGVDREGNLLYPAFPYDHFTRTTDDDLKAIYAYLMTRPAIATPNQQNQLALPFSFRPVLSVWNLLFLKSGPLVTDAAHSDEWNRGRYLAEGLGHCGGCHTPRNAMGAEDPSKHHEGAEIEGWFAYPIDETTKAPVAWTLEAMTNYLGQGFDQEHGVSRGPMAQVTGDFRKADPADVRAIATYVVTEMNSGVEPTGGNPVPATAAADETPSPASGGIGVDTLTTEPVPALPALQSGDSQTIAAAAADNPGAQIYAGACATCHEAGRPQPYGGLDLHLSTAVHSDNPQNIVNMVLYGIPAADGRAAPIMPGYSGVLNQEQMVSLLDYLRETFTDEPAWEDAEQIAADTVAGETRPTIYSGDGLRRAPVTGLPESTK
jgi:mono/diheme cytochrome c family protein